MKRIALFFVIAFLAAGWTHYRDSSSVDSDKGSVAQINAAGCGVKIFIVPTSSPSSGSNDIGTITAASESVSIVRFPVPSATLPGTGDKRIYGTEDFSANKVGTTGYIFSETPGYGYIGISHDSTNLAGTGAKAINMYYNLVNCENR